MKIIVYTISDCQFSKQEKEYLQAKGLSFEEKNLETNREFLTEMLALSNNFAGTPVTKIEKDDGQIVVLKGFTTEEFDKALGFQTNAPVVSVPPVQTQPAAIAPTMPVQVMPAPTPVAPVQPVMPTVEVPPQPVAVAPTMPIQAMPAPAPVAPVQPVMPTVEAPPQPVAVAPAIPPIAEPAMMQPPAMPVDTQPVPMVVPPMQPVMPAVEAQPQPVAVAPAVPAIPVMPAPVQDQALNDILSSLQTKVEDTTAPQSIN